MPANPGVRQWSAASARSLIFHPFAHSADDVHGGFATRSLALRSVADVNTQRETSTRTRPYTILATAVLAASATFGAGLAPAAAAGEAPGLGSPSSFTAPDKVDDIEFPTTISHRGGADVYPEESMEGFTASAKGGFLPEMDIQIGKSVV